MSLKNSQKEEKKNKIIDCARTLFSNKGFEKSSIQEIAKKAGVAKGTVYLYFKSKEEILQFVLEKPSERVEKALMEINDNKSLNSIEKIYKGFKKIQDIVSKFPEYKEIYSIIFAKNETESYLQKENLNIKVSRAIHTLREIIVNGIEKKEINGNLDIDKTTFKLFFLNFSFNFFYQNICTEHLMPEIFGKKINYKETFDELLLNELEKIKKKN